MEGKPSKTTIAPATQTHDLPSTHPPISSTAQASSCPFVSFAQQRQQQQQDHQPAPPTNMPTPPLSASNPTTNKKPRALSSSTATTSHTPSQCPIRLLDALPPEDIASYISKNKHSLPRSHELCIKRYQSNTDSIAKLDAKYGNLESMIKALGSKHQSFLPEHVYEEEGVAEEKEEEDVVVGEGEKEKEEERDGKNRVEEWANGVPDGSGGQNDERGRERERESKFARPLDDVRLGESPSRPWGYRVPEEAEVQAPSSPVLKERRNTESAAKDPPPTQIHFHGPVIIGYPPEQAAAFLRALGMENTQKHQPS